MNLYRLARRGVGRILRAIPQTRRMMLASCDYRVLSPQQARQAVSRGWHAAATVRRQEQAYDLLLAEMRNGAPRNDLKVAAEAVDAAGLASPSLLEIGCGGGYYVDVFRALCRSHVRYAGLDYSPAMVARATQRYPGTQFLAGDATQLGMPDKAFDIVFNGVSLMHILDFEKAIAEAARVARHFAIFHSVPVLDRHDTVYLRKYAYGSPVVEMVFNRASLMALFRKKGLEVVQSWFSEPYDISAVIGETSRAETFLCRPVAG